MHEEHAKHCFSRSTRVASGTSGYPDIIIVVGSGCSGTTYLSRMLKQSMDIGFSAEPKFVVPIYRHIHRLGSLEESTNLRHLIETIHDSNIFKHLHQVVGVPTRLEEIQERVREYTYTGVLYAVFQLVAEKRGHSRLGYKDPVDVVHLPLVAQLLPTARFVHIIRDGRDVALSLLKFRWGPTNVYCGARYWAQVVSTGRRDGATLGGRYFELRFEDMILNTEHVAAELGEFVNRGQDPEQVRDLLGRINRTKNPDFVQAWKRKMDRGQQLLCEAAAGETLRVCGYRTAFDGKVGISAAKAGFYLGTDFVLRVKNHLASKLAHN